MVPSSAAAVCSAYGRQDGDTGWRFGMAITAASNGNTTFDKGKAARNLVSHALPAHPVQSGPHSAQGGQQLPRVGRQCRQVQWGDAVGACRKR